MMAIGQEPGPEVLLHLQLASWPQLWVFGRGVQCREIDVTYQLTYVRGSRNRKI